MYSHNNNNHLPYSEIFYSLLKAIHKALTYCYHLHKLGLSVSEEDIILSRFFEDALDLEFYRNKGLDQHLIKGLTVNVKQRKKKGVHPRLSKLTIEAFERAQESKKSDKVYQGIIIPSPLSILYQALTIPEEPQTSAYAFVTCRGMLFDFLKVHPNTPILQDVAPELDSFIEEDVLNSILSFINYNKIQLRWPDKRSNPKNIASRINFLCGHILAIKRYTYLWFNSEQQLYNFLGYRYSKSEINEVTTFRPEINYQNLFEIEQKYHFRQSGYYSDLPDISEINNWIFGIPIPWRGADLLFFGGLKKSSTGGLVMSLYGEPGAGKTSAALSLSACFAPYQTSTFYITLDENPEDLITRLRSLIPAYLRKTSMYLDYYKSFRTGKKTIPWFEVFKYEEKVTIPKAIGFLQALNEKISNSFNENVMELRKKGLTVEKRIPGTCPLLVIIDNINELFDKETTYKETEEFIKYCQSIGAFVILIAADEIPKYQKLDYLVDVAIRLKQDGVENKHEKPVRILQLLKTRYQISRQGSHVFHLSSKGGFRISPQVPSQMDKSEKIKIKLPSKQEFIHTVNILSNNNIIHFKDFLSIAAYSQILIHGQGSAGKAGFGMKILLTPLSSSRKLVFKSGKIDNMKEKFNKVLIISFLYPQEYYDVLKKRIDKQYSDSIINYNSRKSQIIVKAFYPGFLTPEDFVNKVVRLLEEARLEGEPFTGIMLDGLHNVFLQFENLQKAHMIWPLLYSILYRYSVTVVTTFTTFSIDEFQENQHSSLSRMPQDFLMIQEGQKPFLHGIVKASDYFFILDEVSSMDKNRKEYVLRVRSSIRQTPPSTRLFWDREELTLRK